MLHGFGGSKTDFEQTKADGNAQPSEAPASAEVYHYNNVHYAQRGYAVVNYSARGFGRSCGSHRLARRRGLREGLDPPRRPALRGARHPVPARPARR